MAAFTSGNGASKQHPNDKKVMFCPYCGTKLDDGARFCKNCGEAVSDTAEQTPKVQQTESPDGNPSERKTVYEGYIHKCPNCGEVLDSFAVNCPTCGYEFRGVKGAISVREFAKKLEEIESKRPTSRFGFKKVLENQNTVNETDMKKISLIRSFVIPNTKEDMLEFLILASSNINLQRYNDFDTISESEKAVSDAWQAKFEQAYEKAKLSFGDTPEFEKIHAIYKKKTGEVEKSKKKRVYFWIGFVGFFIIFIVGGFGILFGMAGSESREIAAENERLEAIVQEVYDALENENFVLARAKAATLVFSGPDNDEAEIAAEKWNTTRNDLYKTIEAAENNAPGISSNTSEPVNDDNDSSKPVNENEPVNDSGNSGNKEYGVISSADDSVEVTIQGNDYLDVKEFGWFISGDYLESIITITNKDSENAIEFPTYRITAYDESDKVLGTAEQVLSVIYPKQDFSSYSLCFELTEKPSRIAVSVFTPDDYNIVSPTMLEHSGHKQMVGKNISISGESVTGEIYNPNDYDVDSALVTIIFRNDKDEIILGALTFVDQIAAGGSVPFDVAVYGHGSLPQRCDVLAYLW